MSASIHYIERIPEERRAMMGLAEEKSEMNLLKALKNLDPEALVHTLNQSILLMGSIVEKLDEVSGHLVDIKKVLEKRGNNH